MVWNILPKIIEFGMVMNKIIDDLAYKAGLYCDGTPVLWNNQAIETFAHSIIKECIDKIVYDGMNREEYFARLDAVENILKHFGVIDES